jgi:hypothetical protein
MLPLFIGCGNDTKKETASEKKKLYEAVSNNKDTSLTVQDKIKIENINVGFDVPITFASTNNIAIPLILNEKYFDKGMQINEFYDILVISPTDSFGKLVFKEPGIIKKITTFDKRVMIDIEDGNYEDEKKPFSKDFNSLLFIEKQSSSKNNKGNIVLFVYDLSQNLLKKLSPDNYNLVKWYPLDGRSTIIMTCQFDDNNDGKYNSMDDERIFVADFKKGSSAVEKKIDINKLKELKRILK